MEKRIAISVPGNAAIPWLVGGGVHGSAGPLQQIDGLPCTDLVGLRGTTVARFRLKARQPNSFSFSIPTPLIYDNVRARLDRVFLMFKLEDNARLSRVSAMDGPNELLHLQFPLENRYLTVESNRDDGWYSWDVPGRPQIFWGVGLGVIIDPLDGDAEVTFVSAGVEFVIPAVGGQLETPTLRPASATV